MRSNILLLLALATSFLPSQAALADIVVLEPNGVGNERVAEGVEFSHYVIGNRWDMSEPTDIMDYPSDDVTNEEFTGGIYRFISLENPNKPGSGLSDAKFYLTFQGLQDSMYALESGHRFPIDTSVYRTLTMKIRHLADDGSPMGIDNLVNVYFFKDQSPIAAGFSGFTVYKSVPSDGDWHVVSFDLITDLNSESNWAWTDFSDVRGFRIDPTNFANVQVEIDWIRLTADGGPDQRFDTSWSGGTPPYTIHARQSGEPPILLASGVDTNSANVDLSGLPPGDYFIEVSNQQETASSSAALSVNTAPQFNFLQPDEKGDVDNSYALIEAGNPWGPMDAADVDITENMVDVSYLNPSGSMTATTTNSDSRVILNTPVPINTFKYRMLSYTLSVSGVGVTQPFAIVRVFWGDQLDTSLSTSEDFLIRQGLRNYVIGDMKNVPLEGGLPGNWEGVRKYFRLDPHEISSQQSIRIDDITLAPLDTAAPDFNITWEDSDPDDNATIELLADIDKVPGNGNEVSIANGILENGSGDLYNWIATQDVQDGEYNLYAVIDDGLNRIVRYATGPLSVGNGIPIDLSVAEPNGVDDSVLATEEFSRDTEKNAWDMSDSGDVILSRSANVENQSIQNGKYHGTSTSSDPKFYLLYSLATNNHNGSNGSVTPIDTARYRYLTFKVRYSDNAPRNLQVYFFKDDSFSPGTFGRTRFIDVQADTWQIITIDLEQEVDPNSAIGWLEAGQVTGLRIDPTTVSGVTWEFDWITLSSGIGPGSQYRVQWQAQNPENSLVDLFAVDSEGVRMPLAQGLDPLDGSFTADLRYLPVGQYFIEADAVPGPMVMSPGPVTLTTDSFDSDDKLRSISTRADVGVDDFITIAGFIIAGETEKCVVIRGRGPSVGVPETENRLADPLLRLKSGQTTIASNDDWMTQTISSHAGILTNLGLAPAFDSESAIYACLAPGAYTALLSGVGNSEGIGLVEVVDVDKAAPYLRSISTRAPVGSGNLVAIAGIIIGGSQPKQVLFRGRGPSMQVGNLTRLADPLIQLYQGKTRIRTNDNWRDAPNATEIENSGIAPSNELESVILMELQPGAYTLILSGKNQSTGIGIIEAIDLKGR